ncbi:MAG: AraC family transcriptional regulator [Chitinophagaceae bacterium]|nr:AraC family transcriptional regulator [Chitinophagaceae bacterium]
MFQPPDILSLSLRRQVLQEELHVLQSKKFEIPGSIQYAIHRYKKNPGWHADEVAMLVYHVSSPEPEKRYLELRYCLSGNIYCNKYDTECHFCKYGASARCEEKTESVDFIRFRFSPTHTSHLVRARKSHYTFQEEIIQFKHRSAFSKILPLCGRTRQVLENILHHNYSDTFENIYINAQAHLLLLYCLDCMVDEKSAEGFSCKFLANEADREKILKAREILLQHIGEPITIKELSRKVAMNECYLKKGFKEMFGTTIFDFYQSQRMEHARYLLYEKGLSVTEVSVLLGYSSISHFSTAFKKHTGLRPCELIR